MSARPSSAPKKARPSGPKPEPPVWWVYLLECRDGSIYTGISTDVTRRLAAHNAGRGSKALRGRCPVVLIYQEKSSNRSAAQVREAEIKRWPRAEKLALAAPKGKVRRSTARR